MKNSSRKIRKGVILKHLPDLKRVTNKDKKRVWTTGGKEYASLREVNERLKIYQTG